MRGENEWGELPGGTYYMMAAMRTSWQGQLRNEKYSLMIKTSNILRNYF